MIVRLRQFIANRGLELWVGVVVLVVVGFLFVVVRPFARPPTDATAEDVASSWNKSIARLGMLPVYPPEEDFHVGDVWVVVAETDYLPLLGQAVRLAHIDLRDEIKAARHQEPIFANTAEIPKDASYRPEPIIEASKLEASDDHIVLSLAGFPGITITRSLRATAGLAASLADAGGTRDASETEEITIPVAETYGAPASRAFAKLDTWCTASETKIYCTDEFARRVLAFAANAEVLTVKNGVYTSKLQVRLVTRVFLTREIEHKRFRTDSRGVVAGASFDAGKATRSPLRMGAAESSGSATSDDARPRSKIAGGDATDLPPVPSSPGGTISSAQTDGTVIQLKQVFQRPIVFGYRAITITLPLSTPTGEVPP
jgi:hypothetical protein